MGVLIWALSSSAIAAPLSPSAAAEARGRALVAEGEYMAGAEALAAALDAVPSDATTRGRRNGLVSEAVNAYRLAHETDPRGCAAVDAGVRLLDAYQADLLRQYGAIARADDDYTGAMLLRGELERARAGCLITVTVAPTAPERPPRRRRWGVGIGVSAGAMVAAAVGGVVAWSRIRQPAGPAYAAIYAAAVEHGVRHDESTLLCTAGAGEPDVDEACARWFALRRTYVAALVLTGVFAANTAVFSALQVRERRVVRALAQGWRRQQVRVGAAPRTGGVTISAEFAF